MSIQRSTTPSAGPEQGVTRTIGEGQKFVLLCLVALAVGTALYAPRARERALLAAEASTAVVVHEAAGYDWIWADGGTYLDVPRLLVQWVVLLLLGAVVVFWPHARQ